MADDQHDYKRAPAARRCTPRLRKGSPATPAAAASVTPPVPEPRRLDAADEEVVQQLVERIRQQILAEMVAGNIEAAGAEQT